MIVVNGWHTVISKDNEDCCEWVQEIVKVVFRWFTIVKINLVQS